MISRLTLSARRALANGFEVANQLDHASVEPEHILIGTIIRRSRSVTARVLQSMDVDREALCSEILSTIDDKGVLPLERLSEPGWNADGPHDLSRLSALSEQLLKSACNEADDLGGRAVGDEHLFLASLACCSLRSADLLHLKHIEAGKARNIIKSLSQGM